MLHATAGRRTGPRMPAAAGPRPGPALLRLQSTAGNQAVRSLLQRRDADTPSGAHDLASPRFRGVAVLEACYDDLARLGRGARGDAVARVQQALADLGHDIGPSGVDGVYGARTETAVRAFKSRERLGSERYGDVGPGTIGRLDELFSGPDTPGPDTPGPDTPGPDTDDPPGGRLPPCPRPDVSTLWEFGQSLGPPRPGVNCGGPGGGAGSADWTERYHADTGLVEPLPPDEATALADRIRAARAAIPERTDPKDAGKGLVKREAGHQYNSKGPSLVDPGDDRLTRIVLAEMGSEGGVAAVNTWDGPRNFTFGRGLRNENAAQLITRWMSTTPGVSAQLRDVGIYAVGSVFLAVDAGTGQVLADERRTPSRANPATAAMQVIRDDVRLLSFLMTLGESAAATDGLRNAERAEIRRINPVPTFLRLDAARPDPVWDDIAIANCAHINAWLSAAGWGTQPGRYEATAANHLGIAHAFAVSWADHHKEAKLPNGAIAIGADPQTASVLNGHFDSFGKGVNAPGVLGFVIRAGPRIDASIRAVGSDPALADHVLYVNGPKRPSSPDQVVTWFDIGQSSIP